MIIRLRPHHLLCMLTYAGKGYNDAFVANFDRIAAQLSGGGDIMIVDGPDDICAPLMKDDDTHCLRESVRQRDTKAAREVEHVLGITVQHGATIKLTPALLQEMRSKFAAADTRSACDGCQWAPLCTDIASQNFEAARLASRTDRNKG